MQIINFQRLFKLPLKTIDASTKSHRFDMHVIESISFQTHTDQRCLSKCLFLPCIDYIAATIRLRRKNTYKYESP